MRFQCHDSGEDPAELAGPGATASPTFTPTEELQQAPPAEITPVPPPAQSPWGLSIFANTPGVPMEEDTTTSPTTSEDEL